MRAQEEDVKNILTESVRKGGNGNLPPGCRKEFILKKNDKNNSSYMCNHCPLQCNFFSFHSRRQCFVLFPSLSSHATFCFIYLPMPRSSAQESLVNLDPKTNAQILFTFFLFGKFFIHCLQKISWFWKERLMFCPFCMVYLWCGSFWTMYFTNVA